jgi:FkbM family methyltransferase
MREFSGPQCGGKVIVENCALSNFDGSAEFFLSKDKTVDSLFRKDQSGGTSVSVRVIRGDSYDVNQRPRLVKIDVEGSELEVLKGMGGMLNSETIKCVCVEVHFSILANRNMPDAPREIVALLTERGFSIRWTDPSHILAMR